MNSLCRIGKGISALFNWFAPIGDLVVRIYLFQIFFLSALTKVKSWETTVFLFEYEYQIPLLTAEWAAFLGTMVELIFPVLLLLGLGSRLPAFILFVFNIVAVVSYPFLWTNAGSVGFADHVCWGLLLMLLMFHGSGKISADSLLKRWFCKG